MPQTPMKNLIYRLALPFMAPNPHKRMKHECLGQPLNHLPYYEHLLVRHRVQGATLLIEDGGKCAAVHTSLSVRGHMAAEDALYRVASITKMATALVILTLADEGRFTLDTPVTGLLPDGPHMDKLTGVTVRHLLCHTSGLRDIPAADAALRDGSPFHAVLGADGIKGSKPGETMAYCNLGFGLLGCIIEQATGLSVAEAFRIRLFEPLHMRATLDASTLDEGQIMPICRVLPYREGNDVTITALGRQPLTKADPLRHFGHTAGAMYTDAKSLSKLLDVIGRRGLFEGRQFISPALMDEMTRVQSSTSTRIYGLGLVLLERDYMSGRRLLGHQGFAYGCVDGAFIEEGTGRKVIFLNGGASECRQGKLGLVNRDVLTWALRREMPSWQ